MAARNYLEKRKDNWYFRRRVPSDLKDHFDFVQWLIPLKTKDSRVAIQRAKIVEADTDAKIAHAYRTLQGEPMAAGEIADAAEVHFSRTNAYLDTFATAISGSSEAILRRDAGARIRPPQAFTDSSVQALLADLDPTEPDPDFLRRSAQLRLASLLRCLQAGDYSLVHTFADDTFERQGLAQRIRQPEDDANPHGPMIEWLEIDRSRADYQTLARELMLREIDAVKRSLVQIQKAEVGWIDAPTQIIAQVPNEAAPVELAADANKTPTELLPRFGRDSQEVRGESTMRSFTACLERLEQVTGKNPIGTITRNDVIEWHDLFSQCPQKYKTRLKVKTMREAIEKNVDGAVPTNRPATIAKDISHLRRFFAWAKKRNLIAIDPVGDLTVERSKAKGSSIEGEKGFAVDELASIFRLEQFTTPDSRRPHRYWVPLLCLFFGTRVSEPCRLRVEDVREDGNLRWLRLYNSKMGRVYDCPIHPALIKLGFLKFVERQRAAGETLLFPDAPLGAPGRNAYAPVVQWFAKLLENADLKRPGVNTHGFRNAFITACRNSGVTKEMAMTLVDHAGGDVHDGYGERAGMERRDAEMRKVAFKGLDLSHLYTSSEA